MTDDEPLWHALSSLLEERGLSKRGFAKLLNERDPRQSWSSWLRSVRRYTSEGATMTPSEETTRLMELILDIPVGGLSRPSRRELLEARIRMLEEENRRLQDEVERQRRKDESERE